MGIEEGMEDISLEDIPQGTEAEISIIQEEARFNTLIRAVIHSGNSNEENEVRRRAIDMLTEKGVDAYLIEMLFRCNFTGDMVLKIGDEDIQKLLDAYQKLQSKTHKIICSEGPFRKRHQIEAGAFEEFTATIEMLGMQLSGTCN